MKVKSESEVAQSCLTLSNPMDYSLPGSSAVGFSRQEYWSGLPLPSLAIEEEKSNYYLMQVRIPGLSWVQPLLDLGIQMS